MERDPSTFCVTGKHAHQPNYQSIIKQVPCCLLKNQEEENNAGIQDALQVNLPIISCLL
jgi:hypothetical protein